MEGSIDARLFISSLADGGIPSDLQEYTLKWPDGETPGMASPAPTGNFAVVPFGLQFDGEEKIDVLTAVGNWLKIPHEDVMYLKSLQIQEGLTVDQKMNKWCGDGRPYFYENEGDHWSSASFIRFGTAGLGGNKILSDKCQVVKGSNRVDGVTEYEAVRIVGFRRSDMGVATPQSHRQLFHTLSSVRPGGAHVDCPFGCQTYTPIWDPRDWQWKNGSKKLLAFWLPVSFLE